MIDFCFVEIHNLKNKNQNKILNVVLEEPEDDELEIDFEIIEYLKERVSENMMKSILKSLNMSAIELVRKNEKIWKDNFKGKELKEEEIISLLCNEPKLMERPIIVCKNKAVVGRPKENIDRLL